MPGLTRIMLENILSEPFELDQFKKFVKQFFNEIYIKPGYKSKAVWAEYSKQIKSYSELASYTDINNNKITVLAVELIKDNTVQRARSMQRNFVAKFLEKNEYDGALVAFYAEGELDWRLSFVKLDYSLTKEGVLKELTPAKRYSYLVGKGEPNHTAKAQLLPIFETETNPTLEQIEEAFSIEKVTKDFFEKYEERYLNLKKYLDSNESFDAEAQKRKFTSEEFAKKLMGQIAFLYFLQKKGWLGVKIIPQEISESEFRQIYNRKLGQEREVLDKVFFRIREDLRKLYYKQLQELTTEEGDILAGCFRGTRFEDNWGDGDKKFVRYLFDFCKDKPDKNFFDDYLNPMFYSALNMKRGINQYFNFFNCKIPFLNGGLFDPLDDYDWENIKFSIPNKLFSNRDATGILDVFDTYNFTVNEDEPLEKEVAVDPEMLGKIFENLLDVKDRKSKGAFYTPREIVHYMCREGLINYLVNETKIAYEEIKKFIHYGEFIKDHDNRSGAGWGNKKYALPQVILDNLLAIDYALANVKIADPAVGSGAFPLGMLNEIVKARMNITEYLVKGKTLAEEDQIRLERAPYILKRGTMQRSIFAVDIESSAVDITKLRLWLSLIVDEHMDSIRPLPNLDYNILCGNSLIEEFEGIKLFDESLLENKERNPLGPKQLSFEQSVEDVLLEDLYDYQQRLFSEQDQQKKKEIKETVKQKEWELIKYKLQKDGKEAELRRLEKFKREKSKPYLLWKLEFSKIFREKGGFDIVIGNPPYIGEKGNKEIFHQVKTTEFGKMFYQRRMDYFYFFIGQGIMLLKNKGFLCYITTNYWITASGGQKLLRPFLRNKTNFVRYINFGEYKIFDSATGQHNCIFVLEKNEEDKYKRTFVTEITDHKCKYKLEEILTKGKGLEGVKEYYSQEQELIYNPKTFNINFHDTEIFTLTNNILIKSNKKLGDVCTISGGVSTSADKVTNGNIKHCSAEEIIQKDIKLGNGVLLLNKKELEFLNLDDYEMNFIKPLYKSSEIAKFTTNKEPSHFLVYADHNNAKDIIKCKKLYKHLLRYKTILENRSQDIELANAMAKGHWFVLTNGRSKIDFSKEKIVCPYRAKGNIFGYNDVNWYGGRDIYFLVDFHEEIPYLLGVLNSNLIKFWLKYNGKRKGEIFEMYPEPLKNIPIVVDDIKLKQKIINEVNKILNLVCDDYNYNSSITKIQQIEVFEGNINKFVYELYDLSEDDIKAIEKLII